MGRLRQITHSIFEKKLCLTIKYIDIMFKKVVLKKMNDNHLKILHETMKRYALAAIEADSFASAIRYLEDALKIEGVLIERGIEEV